MGSNPGYLLKFFLLYQTQESAMQKLKDRLIKQVQMHPIQVCRNQRAGATGGWLGIFANYLTLFKPGGGLDSAHPFTTGTLKL